MCFLRTSPSPAALASARGRPLSSPAARGALSSPHCEDQGGLAAITSLIPPLICLLLTPSTDFSSRLPSSLPLTHTHTGLGSFSRPPSCSLGKGNWTERFTFRKAASATYLSVLRLSQVQEELLGGSGQEGGEALSSAGRRLPASRPGSSVQVPVLRLLAARSQLMLSRRLSVSPINSNSWPAAAPQSLLEALRAEPHAAQPLPL